MVDAKARKQAIVLFCAQLFFNALWSILFFSLHLLGLALLDILLLWASLLFTMIVFSRLDKLAAGLLLPYWLWVSFVAILNWQIWVLNP